MSQQKVNLKKKKENIFSTYCTAYKHSPSYPDPLSTNPMLRIALKNCLWIFLGTNLWSRTYGHLPNRTKLINPMFIFHISLGHWTLSNLSFFRDFNNFQILYPIITLSEIIVALFLVKEQQRFTQGCQCYSGRWLLHSQSDSYCPS